MVNSYKVVRGRKAAIKEMPQFMIKNFGHEQLFLDIVWSDNFDEVSVLEQFLEENGMKRQDVLRLVLLSARTWTRSSRVVWCANKSDALITKRWFFCASVGADSFATWLPTNA